MRVHLDFETRSEADLSEVGAYKYAEDPTTEILCGAYRIDDGPIISLVDDYWILNDLAIGGCTFVAHNAEFEMAIWKSVLVDRLGFEPLPPERWKCTMAKCYARGLPGSLDEAAKALGLSTTKDAHGRKVMLKLSKPRKPTKDDPHSKWNNDPEDFRRLVEYNKTDVEVESLIDKKLPDLNYKETKIWELCQKINQRGIPVDLELAEAATELWAAHMAVVNNKISELTDGAIAAPTQAAAIVKWLASKGVITESVNKEAVKGLLLLDLPDDCRKILQYRQQASSTSVAKYETFLHATCKDYRLRGAFQYHGAGTGRWAGRKIQPQNLFRPREDLDMDDLAFFIGLRDYELFNIIYDSFEECLPSGIRGCIKSPEGKEFYVADYNAIEPRVLAWLAGEDSLIQAFRNNEPLYEPMASKIFDRHITKEDKAERFVGKSAVLGCGYSMGAGTFERQYNVPMELAVKAVETYRKTYPKIVRFWYDLERTVRQALFHNSRIEFNRLLLDGSDPDLFKIHLPSGRTICYPQMKCIDGVLEYKTYKLKKFMDTHTYGGKLTENIVQAIARDLLAEALYRLDKHGYEVFLHVHDEAGAEVDKGRDSLKEFCAIMEELPKWAEGIPLKVEGWAGERYDK